MTDNRARELLTQLKGLQKSGGIGTDTYNTILSYIPKDKIKNFVADKPYADPAIQAKYDAMVRSDANKDLTRYLLQGLGAGAAIRGFHGLVNNITDSEPYAPSRVVDLPIKRKETKESEKTAYSSKFDIPYYLPTALVGVPLSVYGGWKGVDAVLDRQRRAKVESELDEVKDRYEQALLGKYKDAVDGSLTKAAKVVEKTALFGTAKGAYLAYLLGSFPLAYYGMNNYMARNSEKALLDRAVKERAIQRAKAQPPEVYAHIVDNTEDIE